MENMAFHSAAIKTGGNPQNTGAGKALESSGKGVLALGGGMTFFDMMFARLAEGTGQAMADSETKSRNLTNSLSGVQVTELPDGSLGITLGQTDGNGGINPAELLTAARDSDLLKGITARKKFLEFLDSLLAGLPEGEKPVIDLSGKITKKGLLDSAGSAEFPGLIAAGISPGQLTEAMEKFGKDVLQQLEDTENIQGIMIGLIKLMPPQSNAPFDAIVMPKALFVDKNSLQGSLKTGQAAMSSSPGQTAPAGPLPSSYTPMAPLSPEAVAAGEAALAGGKSQGHAALPGDAGTARLSALAGNGSGAGDSSPPAANPAFLTGMDFTFPGDIFAPDNWSDPVTERLGINPSGQHTTHTGNLTQIVTHARHAGAGHPSSQIIAAHIQKMAAGGETRNMTLEMQPPDLGKLRVRMEFNAKDKTVRTHMLIEKPETYVMLQRDAHVLERALQNAGLEISDGTLDFELAQDGQEFTHDGSHDNNPGGYNGSGGNEENADGLEIIETAMNWYVDPETGAQRYDLLV